MDPATDGDSKGPRLYSHKLSATLMIISNATMVQSQTADSKYIQPSAVL